MTILILKLLTPLCTILAHCAGGGYLEDLEDWRMQSRKNEILHLIYKNSEVEDLEDINRFGSFVNYFGGNGVFQIQKRVFK